jgi:hypothetical protein
MNLILWSRDRSRAGQREWSAAGLVHAATYAPTDTVCKYVSISTLPPPASERVTGDGNVPPLAYK